MYWVFIAGVHICLDQPALDGFCGQYHAGYYLYFSGPFPGSQLQLGRPRSPDSFYPLQHGEKLNPRPLSQQLFTTHCTTTDPTLEMAGEKGLTGSSVWFC